MITKQHNYNIFYSGAFAFISLATLWLIQVDVILDTLQMLLDAFWQCTGIVPDAGVAAWAITSAE